MPLFSRPVVKDPVAEGAVEPEVWKFGWGHGVKGGAVVDLTVAGVLV